MEHQFSGGNWSMMPNIPAYTNNPTPSNQDHLILHQQQLQPQFHHQQPNPNFQIQQQQQPQRLHQKQPQNHQSLASHFHLLPLVESLAHAIETGIRDRPSDALINELSSHFDKCQQLLNSIAGSIDSKAVTVEGQKHKLEESEQLLNQRKDLIAKYRSSIEELTKSES